MIADVHRCAPCPNGQDAGGRWSSRCGRFATSSRPGLLRLADLRLRTRQRRLADVTSGRGIEPAWITWNPGITPSGLLFYTGDKFPKWKGNSFVGSVVRGSVPGTGAVERVVFNDKVWEQRRETIVQDLHQRIRDVRQGPDGLIYLPTEEDDGAVIRIEPL